MAGIDKLDFNPYELLCIDSSAQEKDIIRAYRKQALKWHPDKNKDNEEYAESMFLKISKALEILTDAPARAAYDKLLTARKKAAERHKHLDAKRRKLKEQLSSREGEADRQKDLEAEAQIKLMREIERLRKEGSSLVQREKEEVERCVNEERKKAGYGHTAESSSPSATVRVRWKTDPNSYNPYDQEILEKLFSKYGSATVVVGSKNKSALVQFQSFQDAEQAIQYELGLPDHPIKVSWVDKEKTQTKHKQEEPAPFVPQAEGVDERDFESIVLRKLRQTQERKRLIEQMNNDDES